MKTTRREVAADDGAASLRAELHDDLESLLALVQAQQSRLDAFRQALPEHAAHIRPAGIDCMRPMLDQLDSQYDALRAELQRAVPTLAAAEAACRVKREAMERWRTLQGISAALITSMNWQSPSGAHSHWSQAGTQTGKIVITKNDYMRDHHAFADAYEQAYTAAFVDARPQQRVRAYATSSGMAAFATVATRLCDEGGEVLAGAGSWFQNKMLLNRLFVGRVHYVDEHDTSGIVQALVRHKPVAVFLDTLCNAATLAMPDLATLLPAIDEAADRTTTVVLDNTCLSVTCQPLRYLPAQPKHLRLIVFESLNKYQQLGADRVTAGMLWTTDDDFEDLFYVRMLVGANISDASVHALPVPDRARYEARMQRIGRNARRLAHRLQAHVSANPNGAYQTVVHPSLAEHPAHALAMRLPFQGGSLNLMPHPAYRLLDAYQRFLALAVDEARHAGVELVVGSSFGFDTTRLYLTTPFATRYTQPFLRISAGTECALELERLGDAFVRAMQRMDELQPSNFASDSAIAAILQWSSLKKSELGKWRDATSVR